MVVNGGHSKVLQPFPAYPYVEPATYAHVAKVISDADRLIVYWTAVEDQSLQNSNRPFAGQLLARPFKGRSARGQ